MICSISYEYTLMKMTLVFLKLYLNSVEAYEIFLDGALSYLLCQYLFFFCRRTYNVDVIELAAVDDHRRPR